MVRSIGFLGVRTAALRAPVARDLDDSGLAPADDGPAATWFRAAYGASGIGPDRSAA